MADNRLTLDFNKQHAKYLTFKIDNSTITHSASATGGSSQVGLAVTFSADDTVQLVGDGEAVVGKLINVTPDNYCTVQVAGAMKLTPGTSASTTRGKAIVGDLLVAAEGYVREVATGTAAELGVARGFFLTATADSDGNVDCWL